MDACCVMPEVWAMQQCNLARLDRGSPQQTAGEHILRWGDQPPLVGPSEPQADDFERWQAGQHVVQARRLEQCIDESKLQACEAMQVTDACLHGEFSQVSGLLIVHSGHTCRSGCKQAVRQTHACTLDIPALRRREGLHPLTAAAAAAAGVLRAPLPPAQISC